MSTPAVLVVCHGNICRSAMAEQVLRTEFERSGLDAHVDSAGLSREEQGKPMDPRAARCLRAHGFPIGSHRAHQVRRDELDADLVIAMETDQLEALRAMGAPTSQSHLLTDFIAGRQGTDTPDPWYGGAAGFEETFSTIMAATPGILEAVRRLE